MNKEEILQNKLNMHLRRNVLFTYNGVKFAASLDLTEQHLTSLSHTEKYPVEETSLLSVEKYLKSEGFFDY